MSSFTFDVPETNTTLTPEKIRQHQVLSEKLRSIQASLKSDRDEEFLRNARPKNCIVSFRMPIELLNQLDQVAANGLTNRGHLLRQITVDFLNFVREHNSDFRGSLFSQHHNKITKE